MKKYLTRLSQIFYFYRPILLFLSLTIIVIFSFFFLLFQTNNEDILGPLISAIKANLPIMSMTGWGLLLFMQFKKDIFSKIEYENDKIKELIRCFESNKSKD